MPRITPQNWKKLKRVFELEGFRFERMKGDHYCMSKDGIDRPIVIPMYQEVGLDIIHANLRTAGLDRAEYEKLLSQA